MSEKRRPVYMIGVAAELCGVHHHRGTYAGTHLVVVLTGQPWCVLHCHILQEISWPQLLQLLQVVHDTQQRKERLRPGPPQTQARPRRGKVLALPPSYHQPLSAIPCTRCDQSLPIQ